MNDWEMFEKNLTEQAIQMGMNPELFHWDLISEAFEGGNNDLQNWLSFYKDLEY